MASAGAADGEPEFQIAPMIDVLLVLLIFFMSLATTTVSRYDPSIVVPAAPDANKKEDSVGELVFNIAWQPETGLAVTMFEESVVAPADTIAVLQQRVKSDPTVRILIRADQGTPVRHVSAVVDAAARAGIVDVTFAAVERGIVEP